MVASGEVIEPLRDRDLKKLINTLRKANCDSIAVSLLFSFVYPEHEKRIARELERLGVPISISHKILPEYRE